MKRYVVSEDDLLSLPVRALQCSSTRLEIFLEISR
jgi:hypothetical protein